MNKFDFIKEWFYKEEERKDCLNNSLNIPIGILTAILAGIYYMASKYNYAEDDKCLKIIFIVFIVTTIGFWLASIFFLIKSYNDFYKGYEYKAFPNANFINVEYENLKPYYKEHKKQLKKKTTLDSLVKNNIEIILVNCIDTNAYNNDRKSAYLHSSKIQIMNCILALFLMSIFFSINYINHEKEEIYKVLITNSK
jgi:hypothetical protein